MTKRGRLEPGDQASSGRKRACRSKKPDLRGSILAATHLKFEQVYRISLSKRVFLGLCAYLCALLRRGFEARAADLDRFLVEYPTYLLWVRSVHEEQMASDRVRIPSYHCWFKSHDRSTTTIDRILLTESTLRDIWREKPYTFMRAHTTLSSLALALKEQKEDAD